MTKSNASQQDVLTAAFAVAVATTAIFAGGLDRQIVLLAFGFARIACPINVAVVRFGVFFRNGFDRFDGDKLSLVRGTHQSAECAIADCHSHASWIHVPGFILNRFKRAFVDNGLVHFEAYFAGRFVCQQRHAAKLNSFDRLPSFFRGVCRPRCLENPASWNSSTNLSSRQAPEMHPDHRSPSA